MRLSRINPLALILISCAVIMIGARIFGPSALQRQDQPRTASYTADIAANGRWLLPRDMFGNTATKPPLVNWLAVPLLQLGFWTEWAVKMPMLLGSLTTLVLTIWMAHRLSTHSLGQKDLAWLAGIAWLVNPANINMIYHCRPDPVLIAFLTAAWILGTKIVCDEKLPTLRVLVSFWLCVGLAGLTKGPAALLPVLYLPLAARFIGGSWSRTQRSRWWWGLPLALGVVLAWAVPCALLYPAAFRQVLIERELIAHVFGLGGQFGNKHITSGGPIVALELIWQNPVWLMQRFLPWSLAAIAALGMIGWKRWREHPLAPAILWMLLVLAFFALSAHKTADYIQPAFPAAAILAGWFCVTFFARFNIRPLHFGLTSLLLAIGLTANFVFFSAAARNQQGENVKAFARDVHAIVHDEPVVFVHTGYNTLEFFLHRNQAGAVPSADQMLLTKWIIAPLRKDVAAEIVSRALPQSGDGKSIVLGLYRLEQAQNLRLPNK